MVPAAHIGKSTKKRPISYFVNFYEYFFFTSNCLELSKFDLKILLQNKFQTEVLLKNFDVKVEMIISGLFLLSALCVGLCWQVV